MNLYPGLLVTTTYEKGEQRTGVIETVHRFSATIVNHGAGTDEQPQRSSHHYRWLQPIEK